MLVVYAKLKVNLLLHRLVDDIQETKLNTEARGSSRSTCTTFCADKIVIIRGNMKLVTCTRLQICIKISLFLYQLIIAVKGKISSSSDAVSLQYTIYC